jgi:hypothetical protein
MPGRYASLELGQAGNPPCPDKYNDDSTVLVVGCRKVLLQISLQAVKVQFGVFPTGTRGQSVGGISWQAEEPYLPMIAALARNYDALRVRNYLPGAAAQVLVNFE